jgi:3D (Asp-Asp-Asp) domain-containing protein
MIPIRGAMHALALSACIASSPLVLASPLQPLPTSACAARFVTTASHSAHAALSLGRPKRQGCAHSRQHHMHHTLARRAGSSLEQPRVVAALASLEPILADANALQSLSVTRTYVCKLTAYGPGFASTGKHPGDPGYGITASGRVARPLHTVAVDPHVIPLGTVLFIDGIGYRVAEDIGGAIRGPHIDVYFPSDAAARQFGVRRHVKVYVFGQQRRS